MPKRVLDGEGLWQSDKLARVQPEWIRAEYANLLPLALANGVFEANPRRVWSLVYTYNRPEIMVADVEGVLKEFERVGLLFLWTETTTGKVWGFWVGIEKSGRLPPPSRLRKKHEAIGPEPPADELRQFIESTAGSQWLANGLRGFGSGLGTGSGSGPGQSAPQDGAPAARAAAQPSPCAFAGTHLRVSARQDRLLAEAFPWVDRQAEYRKVDSWVEGNPTRRPKQPGRFLHNWFSKIPSPSNDGKGGGRAEQRTRNNLRAAGFVV